MTKSCVCNLCLEPCSPCLPHVFDLVFDNDHAGNIGEGEAKQQLILRRSLAHGMSDTHFRSCYRLQVRCFENDKNLKVNGRGTVEICVFSLLHGNVRMR